MIKVIIVSDLIAGGVEKVNTLLAENMNTSKYEVTILSITGGYREAAQNRKFKYKYLNAKSQSKSIKKIIDFFKLINPHVIITCGGIDTYCSILYSKFLSNKCKSIYVQHSVYSANLGNKSFKQLFIHHYLAKLINVYNKCDAIVYVSKGVKDDLGKYYRIDDCKCKVIYNPIIERNVVVQKKQKDSRVIELITIGRLEEEKNQIIIIRALKKVLNKGMDARLCILGEGSLKDKLIYETKKLNIECNVEFKGYVKDVYSILQQKDIFILSSKHESFGNVIIEAMSCGIPVISTDCICGPKEIIGDDEYGYLIPNNDIDALADKIIEVSLNDNRNLINKAKRLSNKFTVTEAVKQYENLIDNLVIREE